MHREIVEQRRWISERRFLHALNYCMILPGPEAQQLATYIGWLMHGAFGGVIAGSLFVVPGFIAMLGLAAVFATWGSVAWVAGLFAGVQSAVVPIVIQAVVRIGTRTLRSRALQVIAAVSFIAIALLGVPFPLIILVAGIFGLLVGRRRAAWFPIGGHGTDDDSDEPASLLADDDAIDKVTSRRALRAGLICAVLWLVPVIALFVTIGSENVFAQEGLLFSKSAIVTFGGAYAVLGYIAQQAVERYGWISAGDMAVGLGLAETTHHGRGIRRVPRCVQPPGEPAALGRRHARCRDHGVGHVRAVLHVHLPRGTICRATTAQSANQQRAHCGGGSRGRRRP